MRLIILLLIFFLTLAFISQTSFANPTCYCDSNCIDYGDCCISPGVCPSGQTCDGLYCVSTASCSAGYFCSGNYLYYRYSDCSESYIQYCSNGCSGGSCLSATTGCPSSCTSWTDCSVTGCDKYWCWGPSTGSYVCKTTCASDGYYAPSSSECCNSWNSATKKCYTAVTCTPNWSCTSWSPSTSSYNCGTSLTQTRTCTDLNYCGTTAGKPSESQTATGTYCAPYYGSCSATYASTCAESTTGNRYVYYYSCSGGSCVYSTYSTESCTITRDTDGITCGSEQGPSCKSSATCDAWYYKNTCSAGSCTGTTTWTTDATDNSACDGQTCATGKVCSGGSCVAVCTPSWSCTSWSPSTSSYNCGTSFTQTRTCTDLNNCGTTSGRPAESQTATGTSCAPYYGSWSACSASYASTCAESATGTQSRTVYYYTCSGSCVYSSSSTESQSCTITRDTDWTVCNTVYGSWGTCSGYVNNCDNSGTKSRTVTTYTCINGICSTTGGTTSTESQACARAVPSGYNSCDLTTATSCGSETNCNDAIDNDCDGNADCSDSDCSAASNCVKTQTKIDCYFAADNNCIFDKTSITQGESVWVCGALRKTDGTAVSGKSLELRKDGNWVMEIGITDTNGYKCKQWTPDSSYVGTNTYYVRFAGDSSYIESWSDARSLTVNPPSVTLYKHISYGEPHAYFSSDDADLRDNVFSDGSGVNDEVSSIKVAPGYAAILYRDINYQGPYIVKFSDDNSLVDDNFNDKISSIQVVTSFCPLPEPTNLAGDVKVKKTGDTAYSSSITVGSGSQVNVKVSGTVTTTGREMYALGVLYRDVNNDGTLDWEYCCCGVECMAAVANCYYTPSTGYCDIASANSCSNVWTTGSLSIGTYTYEGAVYDYKPATGGEVKSSQTASVDVVECLTDADCVNLNRVCPSPREHTYAKCAADKTCTECTSCTVKTDCEPGYCCTYESSPGPSETTGRCLSRGTVINPYLCN